MKLFTAVDHELPGQVCPVCKHEMDRAASVNGSGSPKTGDVSLCIRCGEILLYDHGLQLVEPNENERKSIREDVEMYEFLVTMQERIRGNKVVMVKVKP